MSRKDMRKSTVLVVERAHVRALKAQGGGSVAAGVRKALRQALKDPDALAPVTAPDSGLPISLQLEPDLLEDLENLARNQNSDPASLALGAVYQAHGEPETQD